MAAESISGYHLLSRVLRHCRMMAEAAGRAVGWGDFRWCRV